MAQVTFKDRPIRTVGSLPAVGTKAPDFKLTKPDLSDVTLASFAGKKIVLNIFTSVDTSVCAASVRRFNKEASTLPNTVVVGVSRDSPFALGRFTVEEGISGVVAASELRDDRFGKAYGVRILDSSLAGLFARAVVVIDEEGIVSHSQLVPEIVNEPDYEAALKAVMS